MPLPVGLAYDLADRVVLDPDAGAQQALRHLFATFARTGSARAVVQAFTNEELLFPTRVRSGTHKGDLAWMPLLHWRVLRTLHNPRYAGAFVFGRHRCRALPVVRLILSCCPASSGRLSSSTLTPVISPLKLLRPMARNCSQTPRRTARTAGPARRTKGRRYCRASWFVAGAGGA